MKLITRRGPRQQTHSSLRMKLVACRGPRQQTHSSLRMKLVACRGPRQQTHSSLRMKLVACRGPRQQTHSSLWIKGGDLQVGEFDSFEYRCKLWSLEFKCPKQVIIEYLTKRAFGLQTRSFIIGSEN